MEQFESYKLLYFLIISANFFVCHSMHFHHSKYKVHHEMGKMKIKVKPEGASLIFTGSDLDVDLHPAHGYVRPIHNVVVSHTHHDIHHEEPHEHHHEIEHEEEEDHSGHHDYHQSYHHNENGGHDDEGYGFRHFNRWPNSLGTEHAFLGREFYHGDHHGDHHGHFRDEIRDSNDYENDSPRKSDVSSDESATSRHQISENEDNRKNERAENDERGGLSQDKTSFERSYDHKDDAVIFGKKIYPEDVTAPTHKSKVEENLTRFSSKIAPGIKETEEMTENGSGRGTISPFDDENDQNEDSDKDGEKYTKEEKHENEMDEKPKLNIKELEKIARKIQPSIPEEEDLRMKESERNTKDLGSPSNIFVNMSGEPHNYDEEKREEDYPAQSREFGGPGPEREEMPKNIENYPSYRESDEGHWGNPRDDDEDQEIESFKKSLDNFSSKARKIAQLSNEAALKKDISPPVVIHPYGDPRGKQLRKAFYEYNPTNKLEQHMASINDFNVRSMIAARKRLKKSPMQNVLKKKHNVMVEKLINRLKNTW